MSNQVKAAIPSLPIRWSEDLELQVGYSNSAASK